MSRIRTLMKRIEKTVIFDKKTIDGIREQAMKLRTAEKLELFERAGIDIERFRAHDVY